MRKPWVHLRSCQRPRRGCAKLDLENAASHFGRIGRDVRLEQSGARRRELHPNQVRARAQELAQLDEGGPQLTQSHTKAASPTECLAMATPPGALRMSFGESRAPTFQSSPRLHTYQECHAISRQAVHVSVDLRNGGDSHEPTLVWSATRLSLYHSNPGVGTGTEAYWFVGRES
jgi:hypothetical protein